MTAITAHEILQGISTLGVRVERQSATAASLAATLNRHPAVARVHHPHFGARGRKSCTTRAAIAAPA
ncbi:PLP-dependent transferase, partial [Kocuria atrinae]|uniref:PLP-dependent transferase n=1 Tax=Kocuria atrinae TaxID=592377 RepID=UPI0021D485ED